MPEFLNVPCIVGIFIILDIATGLTKAVYNHDVASEKLKSGLFHKSAFVFVIFLAYVIEYSMSFMNLGFEMPVAIPVCAYVALTEIASIIENLAELNPEIMGSGLLKLFNITNDEIKSDREKVD